MGEAKRRKQLDPDWNKPSLINETFRIYKELFRPRSKAGEVALRCMIANSYRTALENEQPGVTINEVSQRVTDAGRVPGF